MTAGIVFGFGVTHTPGLGDQLNAPPADQVNRLLNGFSIVRQQLKAARPDVIIALINDHFDMFTLRGMPTIAIGVGEAHWGPTPETEAWIQMKRTQLPGHPGLAQQALQSLIEEGVDIHRVESAEFVHNVLLPKKFLWPDRQIPIVPVFVNCFMPPLPTWRRIHDLGHAIRRVAMRSPLRIAVMASGGISHWPPIFTQDMDSDDPLVPRLRRWYLLGAAVNAEDPTIWMEIRKREQEMAASGRELINSRWDLEILERLATGDKNHLTTLAHHAVRVEAGGGAAEMMLWVALMGAMNDSRGRIVMYEPVKEWMGGVGLLSYSAAGS